MKSTPYPKQRRKHIICTALLLTLYITLGLCKPPSSSTSDAPIKNPHNTNHTNPSSLSHLQHPPDAMTADEDQADKDSIDLRGVSLNRYADDTDLSGGNPPRNNADSDSADGQFVALGDADYEALEEDDDDPDEGSRKLWRRRHRSSEPHRKRRRRHKISSQRTRATGRKHPRRDRFLLKSDGPGHVIFSADEVKGDWCRTIPFNQTVTAGRCRPKVVRNNLCYGQCNSFFIPQSERTGSKVAFQSCSFCKPYRLRWVNVTLGCPGRSPSKVQKTILKIESCRCIAAEREEVDKNLQYLQRSQRLGHTVQ